MKKNKFSIIVPVYNVEKYISKCIESILSQDYDNFELIIVNDGSTDKSLRIVEKYDDKRLKIFSKKNGGLSSARNYGIGKATGDYIWFIDGDDYIQPHSLSKLSKIISQDSPDAICFEYNIVRSDRIKRFRENIIYDDIRDFPIVSVSACTKIFDKKLFLRSNSLFYEGIYYEDLELIPYILCISKKVYFFREALYNYVQRENSIMNGKNCDYGKKDDKFIAINNLILRFKKERIYDIYKTQLEFLMIRHLLFVYSSEISIYSNKIYVKKCKKTLEFLNSKNKNWHKNEYLKKSSIYSKIYAFLFRKKFFYICKLIIILKNKIGW